MEEVPSWIRGGLALSCHKFVKLVLADVEIRNEDAFLETGLYSFDVYKGVIHSLGTVNVELAEPDEVNPPDALKFDLVSANVGQGTS